MTDIFGERDTSYAPDPTRVSEPSRESQLPKRFYKDVSVVADGEVFHILLDERPIRTPAMEKLSIDNEGIAERVAVEWEQQIERIDPLKMPLTRLVNTAQDGVANEMQAVKEDIIRFAGTDMLCYRAAQPQALIEQQMHHWDPLIDWAQLKLGARFVLTEGVIHSLQPPETIAAFSAHVGLISDPLLLSSLHVITTLTGSALIAMAIAGCELNLDEAWAAAHVDEDWNIKNWGVDEEAEHRRAARLVDMQASYFVVQSLV